MLIFLATTNFIYIPFPFVTFFLDFPLDWLGGGRGGGGVGVGEGGGFCSLFVTSSNSAASFEVLFEALDNCGAC